jgi:glycosyltransferase involved in cell wall biosynthesis
LIPLSSHLISVIIPCYNSSATVGLAVQSCIIQEPFLNEIILVDDFSTDNTWEELIKLAENYSTYVKIFKNDTKGGNNARNFGFLKSTGQFIQWLDADDELITGKFEVQLNYLIENPLCDVVYSDWLINSYIFDSTSPTRIEHKKQTPKKDFIFELLLDKWSAPCNYLMRRELADLMHKINAWNPKTPISQDREYFTLAAIYGGKFEYVSGYYSIYNKHLYSKSVSKSIDFIKRFEYTRELFLRFKTEISTQCWIPSKKKKVYFQIIDTNLLSICLFNKKLIFDGNVFNIRLRYVSGIRTKIKLALLYLKLAISF